MKPKTIAEYGASRAKIRVYEETVGGQRLIRVRWRQDGKRFTRSWPSDATNKRAAKQFAEGLEEGRNAPQVSEPITLRALWERFNEAEFSHLRPKSQKLYAEFWNHWEIMWGRDFKAERTTLDMANQFRSTLTKQGKAVSTIRHSIETVKMVYRWGQLHDYLEVNKIALYRFKVAKEQRVSPPAEYSGDEFRKILGALNPNHGAQWRAWVALSICGYQGARQNSVLHLKWSDISETSITWRPEFDKMGKEWTQPLRQPTREALAVAREWREKAEQPSEWVFPKASKKSRGEVYTIGALWNALKGAEKRAKVKRLEGRGGHGLRRMLAGDVARVTKDGILAMRSIGDTDMKQAPKYLQERENDLAEAFSMLDGVSK